MRTKPVTPMLAPEKGAVWSKFTKNKEATSIDAHTLRVQLTVFQSCLSTLLVVLLRKGLIITASF